MIIPQNGVITNRNNANMRPLTDGAASITNMYLWQTLGGAIHVPCADGDYDMPVIAHEYGHAIESRMTGKGYLRSGHHTGAMGESWGDWYAMEYLNEYGFVPTDDENPFTVGAYVTGNKQSGIRNYGANQNPLQFGDIGYDLTGSSSSPHADGEIWTGTMWSLREAFVNDWNGLYPYSDAALQRRCADGQEPVIHCPGNRRWIQLGFDALLLIPPAGSMLDAREAFLTADTLRFGAENHDIMWSVFARRGMGQYARSSNATSERNDHDPVPNYESAFHTGEVPYTFVVRNAAGGALTNARIFVGHYERGVSPIADTDPATNTADTADPDYPGCLQTNDCDTLPVGHGTNNLDDQARFLPGCYDMLVNARGYGHMRFSLCAPSGGAGGTMTLILSRNLASSADVDGAGPGEGAVAVAAASDGSNHQDLIDDTEGTNWDYVGPAAPGTNGVDGKRVVVNLAENDGNPLLETVHTVRRVQVSAFLGEYDAAGAIVTQPRFTGLRQFEIRVCDDGAACFAPIGGLPVDANFTSVFTSDPHAFPGRAARPLSPNLNLRTFNFAPVAATHVMIVVRNNQCTGNPEWHDPGDPLTTDRDADPLNETDCRVGNPTKILPIENPLGQEPGFLAPRNNEVHIAELQVLGAEAGGVVNPDDPIVTLTKTGPLLGQRGGSATYTLAYNNLGPAASQGARIVDTLPRSLDFVAATGGGVYDAVNRTVTWNLGSVAAGATGSVTVATRVRTDAKVGTATINQAQFTGALTLSAPAAAVTLITS